MTEDSKDIVPHKLKPLKKTRLSKEQTREEKKAVYEKMKADMLEELTTTPETSPDEALRRIRNVMSYIIEKEDPLVTRAYREILVRSGRDPNEWERYHGTPQRKNFDIGFTEEDFNGFAKRYPSGLEFFVTQGQPFGGEVGILQSRTPYGMSDDGWVGFVRKKPQNPQLEVGQKV